MKNDQNCVTCGGKKRLEKNVFLGPRGFYFRFVIVSFTFFMFGKLHFSGTLTLDNNSNTKELLRISWQSRLDILDLISPNHKT